MYKRICHGRYLDFCFVVTSVHNVFFGSNWKFQFPDPLQESTYVPRVPHFPSSELGPPPLPHARVACGWGGDPSRTTGEKAKYSVYSVGPGSVVLFGSSPSSSPWLPPSPVSKLYLFLVLPVCPWSSSLTARRGGEGLRKEPNHTKAWSSIVVQYSLVG